MNTKRTTFVTLMSASLIVFITVSMFAISAIASTDDGVSDMPVISDSPVNANTQDIAANFRKSGMEKQTR